MASPLTIQPDATAGKDAALYAYTSSNYGAYTTPYVGKYSTTSTNWMRFIIAFDVSGIPSSSTVTGATFSLYEQTGGRSIAAPTTWSTDVRKVLVAWNESTCSRSNRDTSLPWGATCCGLNGTDRQGTPLATITSDSSVALAFVDWSSTELASDVQSAVSSAGSVNWLVSSESVEGLASERAYTGYFSSDYTTDTAKRPKLSVTYTTGGYFPAMHTRFIPSFIGGK